MIDKNIEVARLQSEIGEYIGLGPNSLLFDYEESANHVTLRLITTNPRHNQSFLYKTTQGLSKIDTLKLLLEYVRDTKDKENSYTIQWMVQGDQTLQTSYFSAKNILEALDKLYFDRDPNTIIVFSASLNPTS